MNSGSILIPNPLRAAARAVLLTAAVLAMGAAGARGSDLELSVEARHIRDDRTQSIFEVEDGSVLRSGDGLRIRVEMLVDRPLFLLLIGSSGRPAMVLPSSREDLRRAVPAGTVIEIPPDGGFFPLDDNTGDEAIFAFTATTTAGEVAEMLRTVKAAEGDIPRITRILGERYGEVARVAFEHIPPGPLAGVEAVSPGLRRTDGDAGEAALEPEMTPRRRVPGAPRGPRFTIPEDVGDAMDEVLSEEGSLIPGGISPGGTGAAGAGGQ